MASHSRMRFADRQLHPSQVSALNTFEHEMLWVANKKSLPVAPPVDAPPDNKPSTTAPQIAFINIDPPAIGTEPFSLNIPACVNAGHADVKYVGRGPRLTHSIPNDVPHQSTAVIALDRNIIQISAQEGEFTTKHCDACPVKQQCSGPIYQLDYAAACVKAGDAHVQYVGRDPRQTEEDSNVGVPSLATVVLGPGKSNELSTKQQPFTTKHCADCPVIDICSGPIELPANRKPIGGGGFACLGSMPFPLRKTVKTDKTPSLFRGTPPVLREPSAYTNYVMNELVNNQRYITGRNRGVIGCIKVTERMYGTVKVMRSISAIVAGGGPTRPNTENGERDQFGVLVSFAGHERLKTNVTIPHPDERPVGTKMNQESCSTCPIGRGFINPVTNYITKCSKAVANEDGSMTATISDSRQQ
ncbi:MAG: hypothetical protein WCO78_03525 [Candidatus Roizmanbacteria bacterium]